MRVSTTPKVQPPEVEADHLVENFRHFKRMTSHSTAYVQSARGLTLKSSMNEHTCALIMSRSPRGAQLTLRRVLRTQVCATLGEVQSCMRCELIGAKLLAREVVKQEVLIDSSAAFIHNTSTGSCGAHSRGR